MIKGEKYAKILKLIIPQIIMVSGFIIYSIFRIRIKSKNKKYFLNSDNSFNKLSFSSNNDDNKSQQKINIEMPYLENK